MPRETLQIRLNKGDTIDEKYVILKKLGEGGCGSVYRCRGVDEGDREVAIKLLEVIGENDVKRFNRERDVLKSVKNQYVIRLLGMGKHETYPYLVLEFMEGGSLRDLLNTRGKLPTEEACWVIIQAVRGLRASKTVHRDLKPENLLINKGQNGRNVSLIVGDARKGATVKVADFGLAKYREPGHTNLTNTGQIMGTPLYMSPEQCRSTKEVKFSTDIYSLGIILFELVSGNPPFDADNAYDIMAKHCNDDLTYPPRLDPRVRQIIARCCAKDPRERYKSLHALEQALSKVAGIGDPEPDRMRLGTALLLVATFLVVIALLWLVHDDLITYVKNWWNGTGVLPPAAPSPHEHVR